MAVICRTEYSTRNFCYVESRRHFTAEASTLGIKPGVFPGTVVYDDACDVGFWLVSHVTGDRLLFIVHESETKSGADGDVLYWVAQCYGGRPDQRDLRVIIYND